MKTNLLYFIWINVFVNLVECTLQNIVSAGMMGNWRAVVEQSLNEFIDPSWFNQRLIALVAATGSIELMDQLLTDVRVIPWANRNLALRVAAKWGHLAVVNRLLEVENVDPSDFNNDAMFWAIENHNCAVVNRLLKDERVRIAAGPSLVAQWASECGNLVVFDQMLQDADFSPDANKLLLIMERAWVYGHLNVINRLLRDERFRGALKGFLKFQITSSSVNLLSSYANFICDQDGVSSENLLRKLLAASVSRNMPLIARISSFFGQKIDPEKYRAIGYELNTLWRYGHFNRAFRKIDEMWSEWKWMVLKRQAEFRYHPERIYRRFQEHIENDDDFDMKNEE